MKKKGEKKFGKIAISLIVSIVLFVGLLMLEKSIITPNGTAMVVIAKSDIKEGTYINDENKDEFFEVKEVDGSLDFSSSVKSIDELNNTIIDTEISKGEIVSNLRVVNKDDILSEIEDKVETSIRVSDVSQVVGGILREGDMINISVVNSTTTENETVLENVYVSKTFSSDGVEVDRYSDTSALTVNIIVSAQDEAKLNQALELGTLRISKIK